MAQHSRRRNNEDWRIDIVSLIIIAKLLQFQSKVQQTFIGN